MSTPPRTGQPGKGREEIPWKKVAFVALAVYAVLFLLLNNDRVGVSFVLFTAHTSLIFLILISMGLGAALALFGPGLLRRRKRGATAEKPSAPVERLSPPADSE